MQRPDIDIIGYLKDELIDYMRECDRLRAQNTALIANLETAVQSIQHWADCLPKHFRRKHHFDDGERGMEMPTGEMQDQESLAIDILSGEIDNPFAGEEGESVGVRTGGRIMTPTTEESRRNFAAMLGVHDLCPPCPMTGGEEAAAVYLWPLLSYMGRSGVSFRIDSDKYQTRVHVGLGLGDWTEEDEPDAVGRLDEVVRLISDALVPMF